MYCHSSGDLVVRTKKAPLGTKFVFQIFNALFFLEYIKMQTVSFLDMVDVSKIISLSIENTFLTLCFMRWFSLQTDMIKQEGNKKEGINEGPKMIIRKNINNYLHLQYPQGSWCHKGKNYDIMNKKINLLTMCILLEQKMYIYLCALIKTY